MNVLVTGAKGFVGGRVVHRLQQTGHVVTALVGDVCDPVNYPRQKFDAVIHLAALISHRDNHTSVQFEEVNIGGTERLLDSYPETHFVYVSTLDVERAELSVYAFTKLEAEKRISQHRSYCIVRLTSVFGPGQRQQSKLIPRLLRHHVLHEAPPHLTDEARSCIYVDNAARAVCDALTQHGTVRITGTVVHNRDMDRLVAAAARGDEPKMVSPSLRSLFLQLRKCVEDLRRHELSRETIRG